MFVSPAAERREKREDVDGANVKKQVVLWDWRLSDGGWGEETKKEAQAKRRGAARCGATQRRKRRHGANDMAGDRRTASHRAGQGRRMQACHCSFAQDGHKTGGLRRICTVRSAGRSPSPLFALRSLSLAAAGGAGLGRKKCVPSTERTWTVVNDIRHGGMDMDMGPAIRVSPVLPCRSHTDMWETAWELA